MRAQFVTAAAFASLVIAFVIDALTPQTLVIAILLNVPIVLVGLTGSRRLTLTLVVIALAADAGAAFLNAARDGYQWYPVGIVNRVLSALSIVMVGYLSTVVQERAERVGRLQAQEARARREAAIASAAERIRQSFSPALVVRAIVREAPRVLGGQEALWVPTRSGEEMLWAQAGGYEVAVLHATPSPEIASLAHRVVENNEIVNVRRDDALGRLILDRLRAAAALAIPVVDPAQPWGTLIVSQEENDGDFGAPARAYATVAANALAHAQLFEELAERNAALSERQAVIRDLVYALSHDVRTPLAALAMTLRQAADGAYGELPERYRSVIRDSIVSIEDLQRLAETLLLVARFESGERRAERERVELRPLVSAIGSELAAMAEAHGVRLVVDDSRDAATIGSRPDLRRAIANLVANALQHTPQGGTVEVRIAADDGSVEVAVRDNGYGVSPQAQSRLFQRFAAGGDASGTGLGLYIVGRIAEESGGTVRYEKNLPRGSVFTLRLPKAAA